MPSDSKHYDLLYNGRTRSNLSDEDVAKLFASGIVDRYTPCRLTGSETWRDIDDCLPLLKYRSSPSPSLPPALSDERGPAASVLDVDETGQPARTTALRAGWICFGLGLLSAWIFPPAYFLFSVAIITAIVAMCTKQVKGGLILLLTAFAGMGVSALISFVLAVGLFTAAVASVTQEVRHEAESQRSALEASRRHLASPTPITTPTQVAEVLVIPNTPPSIPVQNISQEAAEKVEKITTPPMPTPSVQLRFPQIPRFSTSVAVEPPLRPISNLSQREIFEEIARIEKLQRELRQQRGDLSPALRERLIQLREAYK